MLALFSDTENRFRGPRFRPGADLAGGRTHSFDSRSFTFQRETGGVFSGESSHAPLSKTSMNGRRSGGTPSSDSVVLAGSQPLITLPHLNRPVYVARDSGVRAKALLLWNARFPFSESSR